MYPASFEYHRAGSVEEAVSLLSEYGDDAKLIAGGHSLIPLLKLRFARPAHLIDVRHIHALHGIAQADGAIVIGAATTHWMVASSDLLRKSLPIVSEAAALIGDPQVRNMGTIGGSLAHADPAADLPAVMIAVGAEMLATGPKGSRTIQADDFCVDLLTSALAPNEVLTQVRLPLPAAGTRGAYEKYPHPASRYALVGVAAMLTVADGAVTRARVALTGVSSKAARAPAVEKALVGKKADSATLDAAASHIADGLDLRSDTFGTAEWRRAIAVEYTRRALGRAAGS